MLIIQSMEKAILQSLPLKSFTEWRGRHLNGSYRSFQRMEMVLRPRKMEGPWSIQTAFWRVKSPLAFAPSFSLASRNCLQISRLRAIFWHFLTEFSCHFSVTRPIDALKSWFFLKTPDLGIFLYGHFCHVEIKQEIFPGLWKRLFREYSKAFP